MKKKYTPPEIYTEDVSIAFTQACCTPVPGDQFPGTALPQFCAGCDPIVNKYNA
jgi:hypothetical protein